MRLRDLFPLMGLTLRDPALAVAQLRRLDLPMDARLAFAGLVAGISAILMMLPAVMMGPSADAGTDAMLSPFAMAGFQLAVLIGTAAMVMAGGRMFGGTGTFADALLLVVWGQAILLIVQVAAMVLAIVMPQMVGLLLIAVGAVSLWITATLVRHLHGFRSTLGVLGVLLGIALLLSLAAMTMMGDMMLPDQPQ